MDNKLNFFLVCACFFWGGGGGGVGEGAGVGWGTGGKLMFEVLKPYPNFLF